MTRHNQVNIWGEVGNEETEADKRIIEIVSKLGGLEGANELKRKKPRIKYI